MSASAGGGAVDFHLMRNALRLWPWTAAALTGVLGILCFAPFNQTWICWIALTPLLVAIWFSAPARRPWLRNLLLGYLAGLVFFTGTFYWLSSLGVLFENVFLRGLPFLLSLYLGMHFAFWAWFVGLLKPKTFVVSYRNILLALLGASAWVTHEWVRGWLFGGFGWNGLGVALHDNWLLIQLAQFTGVAGLSFLVAFANVVAVVFPVRLYQEVRAHRMRPHWDLNLTMLAIMSLLLFGWRVTGHPTASTPVRVAAVQTNIPQREKFNPESAAKIYDTISRLTDAVNELHPAPELVVWPESAVPGDWLDKGVRQFVSDIASRYRSDLLFGIDDVDADHSYNAAVFIASGNQSAQVYHKIHLVPFGEYVPLRHSFPLFAAVASRWVPGDFDIGKDFTTFHLTNSDVQVAPLICFEDTVGDLTRQFVQRGASLLVNVTNDGWFLHTAGSHQHMANAVFRCVETRRPMLRAANTGVTCFVDEFGRVTQFLQDGTGDTFTQGVLAGEINIPQDRQLTFYTRHGELFVELCAVLTGLSIVAVIVVRRRMG